MFGINIEKVSEIVYKLFLATTLIIRVPLSSPVGVPVNLRVFGLKVSQAGNGVPSDFMAV